MSLVRLYACEQSESLKVWMRYEWSRGKFILTTMVEFGRPTLKFFPRPFGDTSSNRRNVVSLVRLRACERSESLRVRVRGKGMNIC